MVLCTDGLVEVRRDVVGGSRRWPGRRAAPAGWPCGPCFDDVLAGSAGEDPLSDDTLVLALRWRPGPEAADPDAPGQPSG